MRVLAALLVLTAVTWIEFQVYPGHSFLNGETQFFVPMLERLDTPGFLSRDLVATNPTFAYTIYDEVTLALHQYGHLTLRRALEAQQLLFRFAGVLGIFLLIRSAGVGLVYSLLLSATVNAITLLTAPGVFVTNPEPVPSAFAYGLILLATGCLAQEKPLLGALAAGLALLYDPVVAGAFWLVVLTAFLLDRKLRWLLQPKLPVLLVFGLLLANLSQLQSGLGSVKSPGSRLSPLMEQLSRMRTPGLWPSLWVRQDVWSYFFLFIAMLWASARIFPHINRQVRWLALGLATVGLSSIALSAILLNVLHLDGAAQFSPERVLALELTMASAVFGIASWHAFRQKHYRETAVWFLSVIWITFCPQVLNVPHLPHLRGQSGDGITTSMHDLADWAEQNTWGSSMFLFADAGRGNDPGVFRALSRRALWTDWQDGALVNYSDQAGLEWWTRWQQTLEPTYSPSRINSFLSLPIDYYVVAPSHRLKGIRTAYENKSFIAYDAQDLRNAR